MYRLLINSAVFSIMSELFPDLGYSYWLPRQELEDSTLPAAQGGPGFYDKKLYCRVLVVLIVWIPIFYRLFQISKIKAIVAVSSIFYAFYMRRVSKLQKNILNNGSIFYGLGFMMIILMNPKVTLAVLTIWTGGYIIGIGRYGDLKVDILGRIIFMMGFGNFIKNIIKT